jgi:hypothetical protein
MTVPAQAPPELQLVAQRFSETSGGVVMFRLHRVFDVHGGFRSRHEDLVMDAVYSDGVVAKVRVWSYVVDGKPAGSTDVASLVQAWEHPNPGDVFAPPYDPRCVDAYQYQQAGPSAIGFTSNVRDAGHGEGSFTYDGDGNVTSVTYRPNVLPPHASSGEISDRRAEVLPGFWAVTEETQEYKGSYGPFAATGSIEVTFWDFRRFADLQSALNAI